MNLTSGSSHVVFQSGFAIRILFEVIETQGPFPALTWNTQKPESFWSGICLQAGHPRHLVDVWACDLYFL